jgi:hypothetical protein
MGSCLSQPKPQKQFDNLASPEKVKYSWEDRSDRLKLDDVRWSKQKGVTACKSPASINGRNEFIIEECDVSYYEQ